MHPFEYVSFLKAGSETIMNPPHTGQHSHLTRICPVWPPNAHESTCSTIYGGYKADNSETFEPTSDSDFLV
ncbi:hypothetical protein LshimejAT787_0902850 [Lyophyllum shimeji]|uniref:Uncharacterized protein n=1 Tax=Lyophyllum shimeji TaxID=47721 RepID=A0A9P3PQY7_LYOSH|nr:hypothetical protein LshimejAT787_0902850 [Lyophyllum shimeji]